MNNTNQQHNLNSQNNWKLQTFILWHRYKPVDDGFLLYDVIWWRDAGQGKHIMVNIFKFKMTFQVQK